MDDRSPTCRSLYIGFALYLSNQPVQIVIALTDKIE